MFCAAKCSNEAELFKTALMLVADGNVIPDEIKKYFALVLQQAKTILSEPEKISSEVTPEAIDLALNFQKIEHLSDNFNSVEEIDSLSQDQATEILIKMEYSSVY